MSDDQDRVARLVAQLAEALNGRGWRMATAESCTGGLIAARCTDRAGSSVWFERGFVTYSNEAKTELLGVPAQAIAAEGAVSATVARAMAEGALQRSHAQVAVAVTGIAGPGGAVPGKPVGTVWMGWAVRQGTTIESAIQSDTRLLQLSGDRAEIRLATVQAALEQVLLLASA
jgi:nicotinamide-nucleotide amidase